MKPNWFIAVPIDASPWLDRVPAVPPGIRAFGLGDIHLTVAFLGAVDEEAARLAFDATKLAGPFHAKLAGVVPMGSPRRYTALSLLLDQPAAIESAIAIARAPAYAAANAPPDARPVKAHVTIARPRRRATDAERTAALAWADTVDLRGVEVRLDSIALYTWSEDRAGSLFRIVAGMPLPK